MKRRFMVLWFLLMATSIIAQEKPPSAEVFGGYSYLNFEVSRTGGGINRQNAHGVGVDVAVNISKWLGIAGDFSYNAKRVRIPLDFAPEADVRANVQHTYFVFGPRFSTRRERATGFFHTLVGGAHIRDEFGSIHRTTDLAIAIGGGVDLNIGKNVAIRTFQFDYLPSRRRIAFSNEKQWLQNVRAQFGIVFRF